MIRVICLALISVSLHSASALAQPLLLGPELSAAWFNPETPGQGIFLDINPEINLLLAGWFTYRNTMPEAEDPENHRWFTLQDSLQGAGGEFRIFLTGNGIFNDPRSTNTSAIGTAQLEFSDCNNGSIEYQFNGQPMESFALVRLLPVAQGHCDKLRNPAFQLFDADSLAQRRGSSTIKYTPFLDNQDITAGMYYLAPGARDTQAPHNQDEVYIVLSGSGTLQAGSQSLAAVPGNVLYVRAGVSHKFMDITDELELLVLFSTAESSASDPEAQSFDLDQIQSGQSATANDWHRFLDVASMRMGSYSLPLAVGGDAPLTHQVDEINFVTRGEASFHVGSDQMRVAPGSIFWVREGNAHYFDDLSGDFTVVILFHQKPGVSTP